MASDRGAIPSSQRDMGVHSPLLVHHGQVAEYREDLGLVVHRDLVVHLRFKVVEADHRRLERSYAGDLRGSYVFLGGEGRERLHDLLAHLETDEERPVRLLVEEALPQGTGSQASTLGWSLS